MFGMGESENESDRLVDLTERLTKLFVEEYQLWSDGIAQYVDAFDDSEARKYLAEVGSTQLAKFVEGHTKEELKRLLVPCAIGHACALTVVCAHAALRRKDAG